MKIYGYTTTGFKNSRDLADRLRQVADFLDLRDVFKTENGGYLSSYDGKFGISFDSKEHFVAAVKAVGDAEKHYTDGDYPKLEVTADSFPIKLSISRDKVCRKVVKFECDPLFSDAEVEAL